MKYEKAIELAQNEISLSAKVGLRVLPKNSPEYKIGAVIDNSMQWIDDECTEEKLDGACAIDYSRNDALEIIKSYHHGGKIYIIAGDARKGVDLGEIVISNATVIGILN